MAPREQGWSKLEARMERCQKLADLLRADEAGQRFAAIASRIERQLQTCREVAAGLDAWQRHCEEIQAEFDRIIARSRGGLYFAKLLVRDHPFKPDDMREEARLCREEALSSDAGEERRGFARRAYELAMLAEAVTRSPHPLT